MNHTNRRILITALTLLLPLCQLMADTITGKEALAIAGSFFGQAETKAGQKGLSIVWDGFEPRTKSSEDTPFYIIRRDGGGFVIIAGNDNVSPILGFSMENSFDTENIPEGIDFMMHKLADYCGAFTSQSPEVRDEWNHVKSATSSGYSDVTNEFLDSRTVQWEQGEPFNNRAPLLTKNPGPGSILPGDVGSDTRCAAGCAPVALAEILTWFGSPKKGDGSTFIIKGAEKPDVTKNTLNTVYDWKGLQSIESIEDTESASDELIDNMAHLILDCGTLIGAIYDTSTSAKEEDIIDPFVEHMGFYSGAHMEKPGDYTKSQWLAKLADEVTKNPVLCCAYGSETLSKYGHAFVIDGHAKYYSYTMFHINFGWGPSYNGYYHDIYQPEAGGKTYNEDQVMYFDFHPRPVEKVSCTLSFTDAGNGGTGLRKTGGNTPLAKGSSFTLAYDYIAVEGGTYEGPIFICHEDRDGNVKDTLSRSSELTLDSDKVWSSADIDNGGKTGTVISDVEFGDRLVLYYSSTNGIQPDTRIEAPNDGSMTSFAPCTPAAFIRTAKSYSAGDTFYTALVNNAIPYASDRYSTVWSIVSPKGNVTTINNNGSATLSSSGQWKISAEICDTDSDTTVETITTTITVK